MPFIIDFIYLSQMNRLKKFLPVFSYIFHPLFVPVYAVLAFFYLSIPYYDYNTFYIIFFQVVIITILVPLTFYYLLLSIGAVESVMLEKKNQRIIPLVLHVILLYILINKSITQDNFAALNCFFVASIISTSLAFILIFFNTKASLHMIGITALTAFLIILSFQFQVRLIGVLSLLFVICGVVATSRLYTKAHTNKELFLGTMIGFLPQVFVFFINEKYPEMLQKFIFTF